MQCKKCQAQQDEWGAWFGGKVPTLEAENAKLKKAAREYMDLPESGSWEEYYAKYKALAALLEKNDV